MSTQIEERFLGGESDRRSIFGGSRNRERMIGLGVVAVVGILLTLLFQAWGFLATAALAMAVYLGTHKSSNRAGSIWQRRLKRRAWVAKDKRGMHTFIPVSRRPADLEERIAAAPKKERAELVRDFNAYRDWPDGLTGLQWLRDEPGVAGIAWHHPTGEAPYLTVVVPVLGQVRGLESDLSLNNFLARYEAFLSAGGNREAKQRMTQTLTRIVPADSAAHEAWVADNLDYDVISDDSDPDVAAAFRALQYSYKDAITRMASAYTQRHYVVGRWDIDVKFRIAAGRRGDGAHGWLALMDAEINGLCRRLDAAGMRPQSPLTARQVAAIFRHMQMPSWPIDQAGDIADPMDCFLAEESSWDHTVVQDFGPSGEVEHWWHRTAVIPSETLETGPRTATWLLPLLTGMEEQIIHTVSVHHETVPAAFARAAAREDLTSDLADLSKQENEGKLVGDELAVQRHRAESRVRDLQGGSGYHGGRWVMHVQISAPTRAELVEAVELIQEAAADCGITDLDWLDGWGQAAHAPCFPVARGLKPYQLTSGQKVLESLGGKGRADALR